MPICHLPWSRSERQTINIKKKFVDFFIRQQSQLCYATARHSIRTIFLQSVVHEPMSSRKFPSKLSQTVNRAGNFLHYVWRSRIHSFRWTSLVKSNFVHNLIELLTVRSSGSEWLDCLRSFLVLLLIFASSRSHIPFDGDLWTSLFYAKRPTCCYNEFQSKVHLSDHRPVPSKQTTNSCALKQNIFPLYPRSTHKT